MKNLLIILTIFSANLALSQIAIGKNTVDGSAILDFASGTTNGIILPTAGSLQTPVTNGTFYLDRNENKVRMYENNQWVDLSKTANTSSVFTNSGTDTGAGVIVGAPISSAKGVLVLESTNQALVLPKIADPEINVKSPYPGMICYDTTSDSIAIFDGAYWNYWK